MTTTATVTELVKCLSLPPLFAVITDNVIDNITTVTATTHTIIVTTITSTTVNYYYPLL